MVMEKWRTHIRLLVGLACTSMLLVTMMSAPTPFAQAKPQPRTWQAQVGTELANHSQQGLAFLPGDLWVNVGDTIVWTVMSGDVHTITFLKPGQPRPAYTGAPDQVNRVGGGKYDGKSYYNSGLMSSFPGKTKYQTYRLTFSVRGDFAYICLLHSTMIAMVHVRAAGTPYPFTQADYNHQISQNASAILRDAQLLADIARLSSNFHAVTMGVGDGLGSVVRIFPQHIRIHVGDTITFTNNDTLMPHTVTFGPYQSDDFHPYGDPTAFDGTKSLNSGYLGANPSWNGTTFSVTFVKAGTYPFRCDLFYYLGMKGNIVVRP